MEMTFNMYTRRSGSQREPHNKYSYYEIINELMRHYKLNKICEAINAWRQYLLLQKLNDHCYNVLTQYDVLLFYEFLEDIFTRAIFWDTAMKQNENFRTLQ